MVFRWRDADVCVPRQFRGYVTFGAADHGKRSQEEIWTLTSHSPWTYAFFVIARFRPPFLIFVTTAVNTSYLPITYAILKSIKGFYISLERSKLIGPGSVRR